MGKAPHAVFRRERLVPRVLSALAAIHAACAPTGTRSERAGSVVTIENSGSRVLIGRQVLARVGEQDTVLQVTGPPYAAAIAGNYLYAAFYVMTGGPIRATRFLRFDISGAEPPMAIGGHGAGPNEFKSIMGMTARDDSLYVCDDMLRRISIYGDGKFVRSVSVDRSDISLEVATRLPTGDFLLTTSSADLRFVIASASGRVKHVVRRPPPTSATADGNWFAGTVGNDIWVAHRRSYRLERWSVSGDSGGVFVRRVSWFPDRTSGDDEGTHPFSNLRAVAGGDDGLMWILLTRPTEAWLKSERSGEYGDADLETVVEVIDPRTTTVVGSLLLPGVTSTFLSGPIVATQSEDSAGLSTYEIVLFSAAPIKS